jgi:hypothetical protein
MVLHPSTSCLAGLAFLADDHFAGVFYALAFLRLGGAFFTNSDATTNLLFVEAMMLNFCWVRYLYGKFGYFRNDDLMEYPGSYQIAALLRRTVTDAVDLKVFF